MSARMPSPSIGRSSWREVLARALRRRCPRCAEGSVVDGWYRIQETCAGCGLVYEGAPGDTFGFMYISTAAINGIFIFTIICVRPAMGWGLRLAMLGTMLAMTLSTLAVRRSIAVALNYLAERPGD
jgi:uncharacterized protein (DUF983 family)